MNIRKILKEDNANVNKKILKEGQTTYEELSRQYCVQSDGTAVINNKNKRNALIISFACVFIALLIIGILLSTLIKPKQPEYFKENELIANITLDEIYNKIDNRINIKTDIYSIDTVKQIYDSVSDDNLYYSINIIDEFELVQGTVYIVRNQRYEFTENYPNEPTQTVWNECNVKYAISTHDLDGINTNNVFGCLEYNNLRIYFHYEQIAIIDTLSPVQFLDNILILK